MNSATHWEVVYSGRASEDLGWYEPTPSTLDLVLRFSDPADAVIDVGAGDSRLVDELLHEGYGQITILDLSETALERAQSRLGSLADNVSWIRADITSWTPTRRWDLWHDRAVFHFLVLDSDQQAYKAATLASLPTGGKMILATFAPEGPTQCAGLPVQRYEPNGLAAMFVPEFRLVEHHHLPIGETRVGDSRPYITVVLQRC